MHTKLDLFVGEPGKRDFVELRLRWMDYIKMCLMGMGFVYRNRI